MKTLTTNATGIETGRFGMPLALTAGPEHVVTQRPRLDRGRQVTGLAGAPSTTSVGDVASTSPLTPGHPSSAPPIT